MDISDFSLHQRQHDYLYTSMPLRELADIWCKLMEYQKCLLLQLKTDAHYKEVNEFNEKISNIFFNRQKEISEKIITISHGKSFFENNINHSRIYFSNLPLNVLITVCREVGIYELNLILENERDVRQKAVKQFHLFLKDIIDERIKATNIEISDKDNKTENRIEYARKLHIEEKEKRKIREEERIKRIERKNIFKGTQQQKSLEGGIKFSSNNNPPYNPNSVDNLTGKQWVSGFYRDHPTAGYVWVKGHWRYR